MTTMESSATIAVARFLGDKPDEKKHTIQVEFTQVLKGDLKPGKHLYLLGTGTGLAPFLSIVKDPETYHRFEKVVLVHGVRQVDELAYREVITEELPTNEYFGENVRDKLVYYPTVTREKFRNQGRLTDLIRNGRLFQGVGLPPLDPAVTRSS